MSESHGILKIYHYNMAKIAELLDQNKEEKNEKGASVADTDGTNDISL